MEAIYILFFYKLLLAPSIFVLLLHVAIRKSSSMCRRSIKQGLSDSNWNDKLDFLAHLGISQYCPVLC